MSDVQRVVVIGGGVVGAASAHYLAQAGVSVTIVDAGAFGRACSHGNCGLISPSHVLPLAEPGAVGKTLKAMFRRNAPFSIKPRFDPALWKWLWRFMRRCNREDMLSAGKARQALLESSSALYEQLLAETAIDCDWRRDGCLFVFQTAQAMSAYAKKDRLLREHFGVAAERYDGEALVELEPSLKPAAAAGGWLYPMDGHLRPDRLMTGWRTVLERLGVEILEHQAVTDFIDDDTRVRAVRTEGAEFEADAFVLATGAWAPKLGGKLGCRLPVQPGKGYSITMPRPAVCPKYPIIFQEHKVAVTPWASGYRLGSTMEFSGYDTRIHPGRLNLLPSGAGVYLTQATCEPIEERWYGWRPMTYDGVPIIGRAPRRSNVVIAAGHNMVGLSMATGTGRLVSEMLTGQTPHIDPHPYRADRF